MVPTGKLMKKHQCQFQLSVIQPPSTGPSAGPTMTPIAKMPWAFPCSRNVYVSRRIACDVEIKPPPPKPWMMRQKTSCPKLPERPHINDAIVKMTIDAKKYCRRPNRAASHGVIGI